MIYDMNGRLVRRLAVGHQAAGMYRSRSHAVYWDGRNQFGESVASGLYFYALTAGDFTADATVADPKVVWFITPLAHWFIRIG